MSVFGVTTSLIGWITLLVRTSDWGVLGVLGCGPSGGYSFGPSSVTGGVLGALTAGVGPTGGTPSPLTFATASART